MQLIWDDKQAKAGTPFWGGPLSLELTSYWFDLVTDHIWRQ